MSYPYRSASALARQNPPPRALPPLHLSQIPSDILLKILSLALSPPNRVNIVTLLSICKPLRQLAMPLVFHTLETENFTARSVQTVLLHLDRDFDRRSHDYFNQSAYPATSTLLPTTSRVTVHYPLSPANFVPSLAGPQFRLHIQRVAIRSRWDVSQDLRMTWGVRGVPFAVLPVLLDIVRHRVPALIEIKLDLPKTLRTRVAQQAQADTIGRDVLDRISRFGSVHTLSFDGWALEGGNVAQLIAGCSSLVTLNLTRSHLTVGAFEPSMNDAAFGMRLRRISISDIILEPMSVPMLLKTCLNLDSLHLLGYAYDPTSETDARQLVDCYNPARRRFEDRLPIAPLRSLVLRPSYRTVCGEPSFQHFTCLLYALSGTLVNLHFSVQGSAGPFFVTLLNHYVAPKLERVWIGYMWAKDEVGDGMRLCRADDRRMRPGLKRGEDAFGSGDRDPLEGTIGSDGFVPPLSRAEATAARRTGGLTSESIVLHRLGLDESLVRALVDPSFNPPWPPTLPSYDFAFNALQPFPPLRELLRTKRQNCLKGLWVFETEYVSSYYRQWQMMQGLRAPYLPGDVGGRGGNSPWERVLNGNHGFNV